MRGRGNGGRGREIGGKERNLRGEICEERRTGKKEMETSITLSQQGHVGVKRFLEGELVEVRQREKGLRGSWHPAVVIGVKAGRRVVEYDELLTDDGREKLTENIPVGRALDGGKLATVRPPWKLPAKRSRALLRPRPPPLPDPSSISWSKGLSVDCYYQDAWWEGVLTEAISSSSRHKRAVVWFPEEEDWEAMLLKDMRVGQQWDEDTGVWSLKGCVDIPVPRRGNRFRTMSLGKQMRSFQKDQLTMSPENLKLAIALKIDESDSAGREAEYASAWNNVDRGLGNRHTMLPLQLNSPTSLACTPRLLSRAAMVSSSEDEEDDLTTLPSELRTLPRSSEAFRPSRKTVTRGRSREEAACAVSSAIEDFGRHKVEKADKGVVDGEPTLSSGESVDEEVWVGERLPVFKERRKDRRGGIDDKLVVSADRSGNAGVESSQEIVRVGANLRTASGPDVKNARRLLKAAGWSVTQNQRKSGRTQWYYRSPNGCLLGSLASAMGMWRQMSEQCSGDDENPTLNDLKSPRRYGRLKRRPIRIGNRIISNGSGGVAVESSKHVHEEKGKSTDQTESLTPGHAISAEDGKQERGQEADQMGPSTPGHINGHMTLMSASPDGIHFNLSPRNKDTIVVSPVSNLQFKRNVWDSDLIGDELDVHQEKRRKIAVDKREPSAFQSTSNRGQMELSCLSADAVHFVENCALGQSRAVDFEKVGRDGAADVVGILEKRSKKRTCLSEDVKLEQSNECLNNSNVEDKTRNSDGAAEHEPRSKKSRVILNEQSSPTEGNSRKSIAILQENSRRKGFPPHKGVDSKQVKKSSTHLKKSAFQAKKGKRGRMPSRAGVRLEVLLSSPGSSRDPALGEGELTRKRTLLSWLIDNGTVVEHEKVRYLHRKDFHVMLEGSVTREGILCNCCKKVVTLSVFEAHAGSKLHRPSANIFLNDGRSLSTCQVEALAVKTQNECVSQKVLGEGSVVDKSDDTCGICGDGGELICCDHCPSTFHLSCMGLQEVPDGDWYCPNCRCAGCGGSQFNGDKTTFNELTVIFCDQCECEYHVKCLSARGVILNSRPEVEFFCGQCCERIFQGLRGLVGVCQTMEGGFSWTLLRSSADDDRKAGLVTNMELNAEHDSKLSIALSVMQECFRPMIDPRTKIDIITHVLYNRRSDVSRLNYHGFYTMLLERGDELISVAAIRVHGARLAEMPLIGTRFQYRRQGMCRRLMGAIEKMLKTLGIERLVLPAVPELLETWTGAFGFRPMDESHRHQLMDLNIMAFPGTSMLYKQLEVMEPAVELPAVDQSGLQVKCSVPPISAEPVMKRGRGRPPKYKKKTTRSRDGLAVTASVAAARTHQLAEAGHGAGHSDVSAASQALTSKRGRPCAGLSDASIASKPVISKQGQPAAGFADASVTSQIGTLKRGRGRPPKAKALIVNSRDGHTIAASLAVVGSHEFAEAGRDAGHACCTDSEGVVGKALYLEQPFEDEGDCEDTETSPTVLRRKRGRPPRARINYNSSIEVPSMTAEDIWVDKVTEFGGGEMAAQLLSPASPTECVMVEFPPSSPEHGVASRETKGSINGISEAGAKNKVGMEAEPRVDVKFPGAELYAKGPANPTAISILNSVLGVGAGQMQAASVVKYPEMEDTDNVPLQRLSEGRCPSIEDNGMDDVGDSAVIRKTTRSMREVRTPLWLVESVSEDPKPAHRSNPQTKVTCISIALERQCQTDVEAVDSSVNGTTKTYERRKTKISPQPLSEPLSRIPGNLPDSQEVINRPVDFSGEDRLDVKAMPEFSYEAISVPIRTFPSQFASRDHNTLPGTFIPVETIVVNSCPRSESSMTHDLHLSETESNAFHSDEQSSGGKLLLRLKLLKGRKKASHFTCIVKQPQPSASLQLSDVFLPPPVSQVSHMNSKEGMRYEQSDQEQLKQSDSAVGPVFIPVTVQ